MPVNTNRFGWNWSILAIEEESAQPIKIPNDVVLVHYSAPTASVLELPEGEPGKVVIIVNYSAQALPIKEPYAFGQFYFYVPQGSGQVFVLSGGSLAIEWVPIPLLINSGFGTAGQNARKYYRLNSNTDLVTIAPYSPEGTELVIKNTAASAITLTATGSAGNTIDGSSSYNLAAGATVTLVRNNTDWKAFPW